MKRVLSFWLLVLMVLAPLGAQTNSRIKQLQSRQGQLKKQIEETQTLLNTTKKDVGSQLNNLNALSGQIAERRKYIDTLSNDVAQIDAEMSSVEKQLVGMQEDVLVKKDNYIASLRYLQRHGSIQQRLMFIFSADNLSQLLRRLRYVREYAIFQQRQGEELMERQMQVAAKRAELEEVRDSKTEVLQLLETEREQLVKQEQDQRSLVKELQKKQRGLQDEINRKRKEANQLNAQIDKLVAAEIEKAAKEAAAREAAAKKTQEAKASASKTAKTTSYKNATSKATTSKSEPTYTANNSETALSSSFEQNRGKLPVPITTSYIVVSRFGQYNVEGMKNVTLDNKGIDIQGKPGAKARSVFNGKVAAIFELNGLFNVLVRHGQYISVYCNLTSTSVKQGDDVTTRQELGTVFTDTANDNRTVLHFQLRKERDKLNPERWLKL